MRRLPLILAAAMMAGSGLARADDMADLHKSLDALTNRIERIQDFSDVEKLPRYYSYYVDKAQWRSVADLFTKDGTLEIGGRGIFVGRERAFEYLVVGLGPIGPRDGIIIDHQNLDPLVTLHKDGKTAEVRATAFVMGGGGWGHVYYENDYVKEDGVWKMKKLHGPFNMYAGYKDGWVDHVITNTYPEKFPPPPDLPPSVIYLTYPSYYAEPFDYVNPVTGKPAPKPDPAAGALFYGRQ